MPLIIRKPRDVLMFRSGVASTARALNETVEQLQGQIKLLRDQLQVEREERAFAASEYEKRIELLLRDLIATKYQIAKREFIDAPSPSPSRH